MNAVAARVAIERYRYSDRFLAVFGVNVADEKPHILAGLSDQFGTKKLTAQSRALSTQQNSQFAAVAFLTSRLNRNQQSKYQQSQEFQRSVRSRQSVKFPRSLQHHQIEDYPAKANQ